MNTTKSKFDHINNWKNYDLEVSAYQKERKGDLKGAIKDLSLAIRNNHPDYFLFFHRGKLFFKLKEYENAINDLSVVISRGKDPYSTKKNMESLFLKDCCVKILKFDSGTELQMTLIRFTNGNNSKYLYGSRFADSCVDFLIALGFSTKNHFEWSLEHLLKIRDSDPDFLKDQKYLLEHLPKEMKPILDLCKCII